MSNFNKNTRKVAARKTHWAWLLPILALAPFSIAAKGCTNDGVVGDDCPTDKDCAPGTAGSSSQAGTGNTPGKTCGGLLPSRCGEAEFCSYAPDAKCGAGDQTGSCQPVPEACDLIYSPVCGCDGKTYGNDCAANMAGVSVASAGECDGDPEPNPGSGETCGGLKPPECVKGEYCNFPPSTQCGSGDQTGSCATIPDACDKIYAPVCGCNGITYGNDCMAASAGVSVLSSGPCDAEPGVACGARAGDTCGEKQYCAFAPDGLCGRADAQGTCVDIPNGACDAVYAPVCGCDGKTYGNDCAAANGGTSVDHEGACAASGEVCGGLLGLECGKAEFCDFPPEMACGNADGTGVCTPVPTVCRDIYDPVCGCDGVTYANACEANGKGFSVLSEGACPK